MGELQYLVLPLRTFALQGFFLFVAIAIEAFVLHNRLGISKRGGVRYSLTLNLISTVVGWMLFFTVEPFLSDAFQLNIMNYVFFNETYQLGSSLSSLVVIGVFLIYAITFFIESQAMNLLLRMWGTPQQPLKYDSSERKQNRMVRYKSSWTARLRSSTLLRANALSYGAIALLLFVLRRTTFL